MSVVWSSRNNIDAAGESHPQAGLLCPRCGRVTLVELTIVKKITDGKPAIHEQDEVVELQSLPRADDFGVSVKHLPDDVAAFYSDAQRVLLAGVPDAAAVQLRKTLEAAAAHKGIREKTLVSSIKKLVEQGYVTLDFKDVMTHIRQIGNSGAHYTDARLTGPEVERSLRFTTQVLRNLFEVPGELDELRQEAEASDEPEAVAEPITEQQTLRV